MHVVNKKVNRKVWGKDFHDRRRCQETVKTQTRTSWDIRYTSRSMPLRKHINERYKVEKDIIIRLVGGTEGKNDAYSGEDEGEKES